ncbi:cyanophycin synthetase [Tumebacillus permanentifrigoris]|uniref:Cyanophycin synthetase n=1 Tax=Tumebacillus permanentifrigoris TaxID=378543 RepID=A0A316DRY3_9BACL|nr:cyanophycin synthetase [Tumebacillus permanentifrigoris]PWK07908.1 cyanophycin synthetase [Tumebacillus permanentifrigoris]
MKIEDIRYISGPNLYSHLPAMVMRIDLQECAGKESYEFAGLNQKLLEFFPGLRNHHCAKGEPGGFVERLDEGTYIGHVIEHVALEMAELVGIGANRGKTTSAAEGVYDVFVECTNEAGMAHLLRTAFALVEALTRGESYNWEPELEEAKRQAGRTGLGQSTKALVEAAQKRGIPFYRLNTGSLIQLGTGRYLKRIQATITERTSCIGVDIACDKELTKQMLDLAAIPVPFGGVAYTEDEAVQEFRGIERAVVVKPLDGNQGKGVSLNLVTEQEVREAFRIAQGYSEAVIVESFLEGRHYRVLVVGEQVAAVAERMPAHITGDGTHTIRELIEQENQDPRRGDGHEAPLTKIKIDDVMHNVLAREGRQFSDVPHAGEIVILRDNANLSTGGIAIDVTGDIHPTIAEVCVRTARIVGLDICGIDLVCPHIAEPFDELNSCVIEVNAAPGIRMHESPSFGDPRNVGEAIVDMLYPANHPSRIPVIAITGTNGKTTTTRMIGHVIQATGKTVGMTSTDGIYINGKCIAKGDTTGPRSARAILSDPGIDVAVLETARGGIVRAGLGFDWADVGIITNIQPDHLGCDGIETVEDLIQVKSLVTERVRPGGTVILNADDPILANLPRNMKPRHRAGRKFVYFTLHPNSRVLKRHLSEGGTGYFFKDGWIMEARGEHARRVLRAEEIPVTMLGAAHFHVQNAMAAIAACRAHGMTREKIATALRQFRSDVHNPGRVNLYQVRNSYVLVDYGHNPHAFQAICEMAGRLPNVRVTGVVGVPGDRNDDIVSESGRAAANGFHRLFVKEDVDLRGRRPGEVANLLERAIQSVSPDKECRVIHNEVHALEAALSDLQDGELVVVFYEKLAPVMDVLRRHEAVSVSHMSLKYAKV